MSRLSKFGRRHVRNFQLKRKYRGRTRTDNRNYARSTFRFLEGEAVLPPCMVADVPRWNERKGRCEMGPVNFLPIHAVLEVLILLTGLSQWLRYSAEQICFRRRVVEWGKRVGMFDTNNVLPISIWGDGAPTFRRNSLYLLTW